MNLRVCQIACRNQKLASAVVLAIPMLLNSADNSYAKKGDPVSGVDVSIGKKPCCKASLGSGGLPEVPPSFFGPGSLPFDGALNMDLADPVFFHHDAGSLEGEDKFLVPTELLTLNLTSITPIEPVPGTFFDVTIGMHSASPGYMLLTNDDSNAFLIDSFFDIFYDIQFTPVGGGATSSLQGTMPLKYSAPIPWDNTLPGGSPPPLGGNFVLGSDGATLVPFFLQSPDGAFSVELETVPEPSGLLLAAICAFSALSKIKGARNL